MLQKVGTLFVITVLLLGPAGVVGQCVNCNQIWGFHCEVNVTGYYCEPGAKITQTLLSEDELATSTIGQGQHDQCTPYPFHAGFIKTFCCFYSPSIGCQLAINPSVLKFESRPRERCMMCNEHCRCVTSGAPLSVQSWTVLCLLASLALSQTCLHSSRSG